MSHLFKILILLLSLPAVIYAQSPNGINYQLVVRDGSGNVLSSRAVSIRFALRQGSAAGTVVFAENHSTTSSSLGLVNLVLGNGTASTGSLASVNWSAGPYFLETLIDQNGGSTYTSMGAQQLSSVPYALYAKNGLRDGTLANQLMYWDGSKWEGLAPPVVQGQVLKLCSGNLTWVEGGVCPGTITSLNCGSVTNSGALNEGMIASGVSSSVPYTGGNGEAYSAQSVSSTGVTGLTASLAAGTLGIGSGSLTYTITGAPSATGTASFALSIGGQTCTLSRTVNASTGSSTSSCGAWYVHNSALSYGSMTDQNGNLYKTIIIGGQEWMAENLRARTYRNGIVIPINNDTALTTAACGWYDNDSTTYACPYGRLYNWYAVASSNNICPVGWHVPSDAEWTTLVNQLGGLSVAGGEMKSNSGYYWPNPLGIGYNSSGFSGLPGGFHFGGTLFDFIGEQGYWWSSTENNTGGAIYRYLVDVGGSAHISSSPKNHGVSVRCLRD